MFSVFYRIHRISLCRLFGIARAGAFLGMLLGMVLAFGGCGFKGDPYFSTPSQAIDFKDLDNIDTRVE